jgi:hypothetical protein
MGARRAIVPQKDVTRILKGAAAAGITLEVRVKDGEARFVQVDGSEAPDALSDIGEWRKRRDARKAGRRA